VVEHGTKVKAMEGMKNGGRATRSSLTKPRRSMDRRMRMSKDVEIQRVVRGGAECVREKKRNGTQDQGWSRC
jgi:hypothetical protein